MPRRKRASTSSTGGRGEVRTVEDKDVEVAGGWVKVEGEEAVGTEGERVEEGEHEKVVGLDKREIGDEKSEEAQWEEAAEVGTEVVGMDE